MKWLNKLSEARISFYTYKLNINDCIIYNYELFNSNTRSFIVISGLLYLQKVFLNGEKLCIAILTRDTLLHLDFNNISKKLYYYQLISLNTSYIISLCNNDLYAKKKQHIILNMHKGYCKTLIAYEKMIHILTHKYIKYRVIQLLLFLSIEEGNIINNTIIIPFYISQSSIGNIVGSNKNTINKIIKALEKQKIICYSNYKRRIIIKDIIGLNKAKLIL